MEDFIRVTTDMYSFSRFALDPPFSLPLMDFALSVDSILPPDLSNRLHHLVKVVEQAFKVIIEPHRMFDMLTIVKQKSADGKNMLNHNKNIEEELNKYSANVDHVCEHPTSAPFCLPFLLIPKSSQCPQCDTDLSSSAKHRIVTLYLADGSSKSATVVSYICQSKQCSLEIFPNFITNLSDDVSYSFTTKEFFFNGKYIYLGGQTSFESLIFKQYSGLLSNGHVAFDSFTRAFNQLSDDQHIYLERRLFERVFIIHALIEFQLFMGMGQSFRNQSCAFLPRNLYNEIDKFIMMNYDHFYKVFVQFWSSHNTFHPCKSKSEDGPDDNLCSAVIICDGHMKIRRRLCSNSNIPLHLPVHFKPIFKELVVGCSHTPNNNGKLCTSCDNDAVMVEERKQRRTKKQTENTKRKLKNLEKKLEKKLENDMGSLGCNVRKEDIMIDQSTRACGILVIATNCQVVIGFEEILRTESRKQVAQALANVYSLTPMLTKIVIYDAGCLLAKFVRANFQDDSKPSEVNASIGLTALKEVRFFVDRFHLSNHKEKYCHENLNLDLDDSLKHINSSSCEQINSWIKSYSHMLSNMNEYRFAAILLVLLHLRNCSHTKLCNRWVDVRQLLANKNNKLLTLAPSSSNQMTDGTENNIISNNQYWENDESLDVVEYAPHAKAEVIDSEENDD